MPDLLPLTLNLDGLVTVPTFVPRDSISLLVHVGVGGLHVLLVSLVLLGDSNVLLDSVILVRLLSLAATLDSFRSQLLGGRVDLVSSLLVLFLTTGHSRDLLEASIDIFFRGGLLSASSGEVDEASRSLRSVLNVSESKLHQLSEIGRAHV